jgi:hypothetical protein
LKLVLGTKYGYIPELKVKEIQLDASSLMSVPDMYRDPQVAY